MKREQQLIKNSVILSIGSFLPKFASIITLPILTGCLTKTEYGLFDLLNTLVSLVLPVATLKIEAAAFRFLIEYRDSEKDKDMIISTIIFFLLPISVLSVCILYFFIPADSWVTKSLICLYFFLDMIYLTLQQIARGMSKNLLYSINAVIYAVINMVLIIVLIQDIGMGLNGLLLSMIAAQTVAIVGFLFPLKLCQRVRINYISKEKFKQMINYSWPMIPNSLSGWVMNLSDRLIISFTLGLSANAVYAVANKIPNLFTSIQSVLVYAWQENASLTVKDKDSNEYYSKMFNYLWAGLVGIMALLITSSPLIFQILVKGDYISAYYQMPLLFGGIFFSSISSFLGGIYVAYKKTNVVGITTIIAAVINFLINIIFINFIGITAASLSTFISFVFLVIYRIIDLKKISPLKINWGYNIFSFSSLVILSIIFMFNNLYLNIVNFIIAVGLASYFNKDILSTIVRIFRRKLKTNAKKNQKNARTTK